MADDSTKEKRLDNDQGVTMTKKPARQFPLILYPARFVYTGTMTGLFEIQLPTGQEVRLTRIGPGPYAGVQWGEEHYLVRRDELECAFKVSAREPEPLLFT
jgi:hypothetical protein